MLIKVTLTEDTQTKFESEAPALPLLVRGLGRHAVSRVALCAAGDGRRALKDDIKSGGNTKGHRPEY